MYCTKCGKKNPEGNKYCRYCGALLKKRSPRIDDKPADTLSAQDQAESVKFLYCTKCGKQVPASYHFCDYCGAPLRKEDSKPQIPKNKRQEGKIDRPEKPMKWKPFILVAAICFVVLVGGVLLVLKGGFGSNEAEAFYEDNGEVLSKIEADKSEDTQTESEAIKEMRARGFNQYDVTYDSVMGGDFEEDQEASNSSQDKHPSYKTYFKTEEGTLWTITAINGSFSAYPVDAEWHTSDTETLISEKESIWCYDIDTNTYFEVIPNSDAVKVIVIDKINADTLKTVTKEGNNEQ